ncbi:MAG: tetratricopeptide repeat protein [Oceanobacter sp.]
MTLTPDQNTSTPNSKRPWLWALLVMGALGLFGLIQLYDSLEEEREYFDRPARSSWSENSISTGKPGPLPPGAKMPANHPSTNRSSVGITSNSKNSKQAGALPDLALKLQNRLINQTPEDHSGWWLLGQTWLQLGQPEQAVQAFQTALKLQDQPRYRMGLANALYTSNSEQQAQAKEMVLAELAEHPKQLDALRLALKMAKDQGNTKEALKLEQRIMEIQDQQPSLRELNARIAALSAKRSGQLNEPAESRTQTSSPKLHIRVTLAPELQAEVTQSAVLFVYAKAMNGPAFPLAAARFSAHQLPLDLTLSDAQQVVPMAKLSDHQGWKVGARISASGQATAQAGDLFVELNEVTAAAATQDKPLQLVIQNRF